MSHICDMTRDICAAWLDVWCHTYEWVMSHIWMSHVPHIHESCHTYEWVMSHIFTSHVTCMNESCHTYESKLWHVSQFACMVMRAYGTHIHESWLIHIYEWVMTHSYISNCDTCHNLLAWWWRLMAHIFTSHDSFIYMNESWLIHIYQIVTRVTICLHDDEGLWHTYSRVMTHSYVWHIHESWLIHIYDMTRDTCLP